MSIYGRVDCNSGASKRNTGFGDCVINPKLIKGGMFVPSTFKLSREQLATPGAAIAALKAAAKADLVEDRIYPIQGFINPKDNTGDKTTRTTSDGSESVVRDGLVNWSWEFTQGGLTLLRALRTHNENGGYFIFWDSDYVLYGWGKNHEIYGIPLNFKWANPWKQNDGSNPAIYDLQVVFPPNYVNDEVGFAKLNAGLTDVKGLRDVEIIVNEFDGDLGHLNLSLITSDSAYNMFDKYGGDLDDKVLYSLINFQTGREITILSLAQRTSDKSFDMVISVADADYPDNEGDVMILSLAPVSKLEDIGVEGFEGVQVELILESGSAS